MQDRGGLAQVVHVVVGHARHLLECRLGGDLRREVVLDDQVEFVVDLAVQLVDLQSQEPRVDAELDDHRLDLVGDPVHHLAALDDRDHVAQGDDVFDLDSGEVGDGVVEFGLVSLECLQGLVGPFQQWPTSWSCRLLPPE